MKYSHTPWRTEEVIPAKRKELGIRSRTPLLPEKWQIGHLENPDGSPNTYKSVCRRKYASCRNCYIRTPQLKSMSFSKLCGFRDNSKRNFHSQRILYRVGVLYWFFCLLFKNFIFCFIVFYIILLFRCIEWRYFTRKISSNLNLVFSNISKIVWFFRYTSKNSKTSIY